MPKRLETRIWQTPTGYLFSAVDESGETVTPTFKADSPEYFAWIAGLKSFHFESKAGRFTARRETRKNKGDTIRRETYWSAYRKHNHKQLRRYLGTSDKLSVAMLEGAASHLTEICNTLPAPAKKPRRRPEHRAVLLARIDDKDKIIVELQGRIRYLEQEVQDLKIKEARWIADRRRLEH